MAEKKKEKYFTETQKLEQRNKAQIGLRLAPELVERLRNFAWATQIEGGVNGIIEAATEKAIERLERDYQKEHGKPVPSRPAAK
jgi:predicted DNA-binding protein